MVNAFKFGECFGYKVFDTCWTHDTKTGKTRLPYNGEEVVRFVAQSAIFSGVGGAPWAARTLKDGHKNFIEDSPLSESLGEAAHYYHRNFDLFSLPAENNVKLLYVPDNCMCMVDKGIDNIFDTVEELVNEAIPFSITVEEKLDSLEKGQIVILPKVYYASEELIEKVKKALSRGVKFIIIGHFARYYEDGKERRHSHSVFELSEKDGVYRTDENFVSALRELNKDNEITLSSPYVLLERKLGKNGETVLHLLNAENENTIPELTVTLNGVNVNEVSFVSLEDSQAEVVDSHTIIIKNLKTTVTLVLA